MCAYFPEEKSEKKGGKIACKTSFTKVNPYIFDDVLLHSVGLNITFLASAASGF